MSIPEEMQQQWPGVKFNDTPRLPSGDRAMFVRVLDKSKAKETLGMVRDLNPQAPAHLDKERGLLRVYAPDGDLVFSMMPTDERKAHFICRLHKEVFTQ